MEHIIIIGGGIGGALAHDLALRGFRVTLLEKGALASGSTGRHHGLLHSGARYVLHDLATAGECWQENRILCRIAPDALEQNDGLFVALDNGDMAEWDGFIQRCTEAGIPADPLTATQARTLEPNLTGDLKGAVRVGDAVMDPWRLSMHFFASARFNGAHIHEFSQVTDVHCNGSSVTGVQVVDHHENRNYRLDGDVIVNAAGPWAGQVAAMLGIVIPVRPVPGVMVSVAGRLTEMVVNRLHPADDGDIIVPQRNLSVLGTSAWLADDPDRIEIPADHVRRITRLCARMVPKAADLPIHATWSAARPLIVPDENAEPTKISRSFDCLDHGELDGIKGFISLIGGKATTMRAMAEAAADLICTKTGRNVPCRTRQTPLRHYRQFYQTI